MISYLNISGIFDNDKEELFSESSIEKERLNKILSLNKSNKHSFSKGNEENGDISNKKELIDKIVKEIKEETSLDSIRLVPGKNVKTDDDMKNRTKTKIGGNPYWPADKPYPKNNGKELMLFAQLNLSQIPKLQDYPTKGILQFFVNDIDKDDATVVYHENIVSEDKMLKDIPNSTIDKDIYGSGDKYSPISGVYFPTFSKEETYISFEETSGVDKIFIDLLVEKVNKYFKTEYTVSNIPNDIWDEAIDKLHGGYGTRIGGHPYLIQGDPRTNAKKKYDTVLLQLDSESGMKWGDNGIAHFFINKQDLENKKFDNIFFSWACY